MEHPWRRLEYSSIKSADGIVVLSGGGIGPVGVSNIIEWNDPDRFLAGIELYNTKKSPKLIFTGGANPLNPSKSTEGGFYQREALYMGIPKKDILVTKRIFNTLQEAKAIKELFNKELNSNQKKIILVTSAFHMQRAKRVFEREGMKVYPYPVDFRSSKNHFRQLRNPIEWMPNSKNLFMSSIAIREIIGRIIYFTL